MATAVHLRIELRRREPPLARVGNPAASPGEHPSIFDDFCNPSILATCGIFGKNAAAITVAIERAAVEHANLPQGLRRPGRLIRVHCDGSAVVICLQPAVKGDRVVCAVAEIIWAIVQDVVGVVLNAVDSVGTVEQLIDRRPLVLPPYPDIVMTAPPLLTQS